MGIAGNDIFHISFDLDGQFCLNENSIDAEMDE